MPEKQKHSALSEGEKTGSMQLCKQRRMRVTSGAPKKDYLQRSKVALPPLCALSARCTSRLGELRPP
jgi:hypothetical protein